MIAVAERRALFDALVEADRRAKGLVFRVAAVAPLGSPDPFFVFIPHFVEYADEAPPGRYWNADDVPDAIGDEWSLCVHELACSWCGPPPGTCPDCRGAGRDCTNCKGSGRCLMCEASGLDDSTTDHASNDFIPGELTECALPSPPFPA